MNCKQIVAVVCAALMVSLPVVTAAGGYARLIPSGQVALQTVAGERLVSSAVPVPENTVMMCKGICLVQSVQVQLTAHDQAIFAVTTGSDKWQLVVKEGTIDFALKGNVFLQVRGPENVYEISPASVRASTDEEAVRGTVSVKSGKTILTAKSGAIKVVSSQGEQILREGMALQLAQAELPGASEGAGAGSGLLGKFGAMSTLGKMALLGGVAAGAGLASWGIYEATSGGGGQESPF